MSSWVNFRMEYQEINISFLLPTADHSMEHEEIFTWSRGVRRLTSLTGERPGVTAKRSHPTSEAKGGTRGQGRRQEGATPCPRPGR